MAQAKLIRHYRVAKREHEAQAMAEEQDRRIDNFLLFIKIFSAVISIIASVLGIIIILRSNGNEGE